MGKALRAGLQGQGTDGHVHQRLPGNRPMPCILCHPYFWCLPMRTRYRTLLQRSVRQASSRRGAMKPFVSPLQLCPIPVVLLTRLRVGCGASFMCVHAWSTCFRNLTSDVRNAFCFQASRQFTNREQSVCQRRSHRPSYLPSLPRASFFPPLTLLFHDACTASLLLFRFDAPHLSSSPSTSSMRPCSIPATAEKRQASVRTMIEDARSQPQNPKPQTLTSTTPG